MAGERLMCVWQAIFTRDVFPESGVKKATVKSVTEAMRHLKLLHYQESRFEETFTTPKVPFLQYKEYVCKTLRTRDAPVHLMIEQIEEACWEMVEETEIYQSDHLVIEDVHKLWQVFNRISNTGSYTDHGPLAGKEQVNWLFEELAKILGKTWGSKEVIPKKGYTFKELLNQLDRTFFATVSAELLSQCMKELHSWLVREVMKVGWLNKRTKKQANWTNWLKRWCMITPIGLHYFENEKCRVLKGVVMIEKSTTVESQQDLSSFTKKRKYRLKISNKPTLEIELCAETDLEKQQWIGQVAKAIESARTGITPISKFMQERFTAEAVSEQDSSNISEMHAIAKRMSTIEGRANTNGKPKSPLSIVSEASMVSDGFPAAPPVADDIEVYDNNAIEVQKEKIQMVFYQIDKDGNGKVDKNEFSQFVKGLGIVMPQIETDLVFDIIDTDDNNYVCFDEFYNYFIRFVMGESDVNATEAKLRAAFLAADRDESGTVSFKEFAEFAWNERRDMALNHLVEAFENLDVDKSGEISFKEFRNFFQAEAKRSSFGQIGFKEPGSPAIRQPVVEHRMRHLYDQADSDQLVSYLRTRWNKFASFRREGVDGDLVMTGGGGMVGDCVPGNYSLLDLACFNDLPPIIPRHTVVKATWMASNVPGKSGRLTFPSDFDGKLEVDIATAETLAYYGCTLADGNQLKVSLLYRHGIQDFTYENNYLDNYVLAEDALAGAGLERHGFAHLDCPMDHNSGYFIIAKEVDDGLHLTAFTVPPRQTLYIPPYTIHCNDYLVGTWRTMLSDEANIDHVQLVKSTRKGNVESVEYFRFTFADL